MFSLVLLSRSKVFTRAALVSHSCCSFSTHVALVSHLCYTRVVRIALVSLVSDTLAVIQTRSLQAKMVIISPASIYQFNHGDISMVQYQQLKHQKKLSNMFKVNNKNSRTTSMMLFWCFIVNFEHMSHLFSSVSIVDFEQINDNQVETSQLNGNSLSYLQRCIQNPIKQIKRSFLLTTCSCLLF